MFHQNYSFEKLLEAEFVSERYTFSEVKCAPPLDQRIAINH